MKKTNSSPSLRHRPTTSTTPAKKTLSTGRPPSSSGKKKSVGFELADSDYEGEWEDTTAPSPESSKRDSVQLNNEVAEKSKLLVDPLTFVKRPYPPGSMSRAASLPEPSNVALTRGQATDDDEEEVDAGGSDPEEPRHVSPAPVKISEQHNNADNAMQLLSQSHGGTVPPTMSSTSATGKPTTVSRKSSLINLAAAHGLYKRTNPPSPSSTSRQNSTPYTPDSLQATSSSNEGVSRFIDEKRVTHPESDTNASSSFQPHSQPQAPPSPSVSISHPKDGRGSPPFSRPRDGEPHSRTQQKLWLQRNAPLNTAPSDLHVGSAGVSTAAIDPVHTRTGYDHVRRAVNGNVRVGGQESEAKHVRKAYEKTAMELAVVRRFQSPTGDSFGRINFMLKRSNDSGPHSTAIRPARSELMVRRLWDSKEVATSS